MIKVVLYGIIFLVLPYFPGVFTDIYYLFPLNSMTLPSQGGVKGGGELLQKGGWVDLKRYSRGIIDSVENKEGCALNNISEDRIRLSLKVDKLKYLNHIPLEKISQIYIVLTDETIRNLIAQHSRNQIPLNKGGLRGLLKTCIEKSKNISPSKVRDKIVFSLPTIMRDMGNGCMTYGYFKKVVHELISQDFRQFQISNLGAMELFDDKDVQLYADYPLYCLNPFSALKLRELGFCRHTLSPEDDKENLQKLFALDADVIVYQDTPLFTSETCVWANMKNTCPGRNRCGFKQTILENEYGDQFLAIDEECKTVVIGERPFSIIHLIPKLLDNGQIGFRIDLCYKDYSPEMIEDIFSKIQNKSKVKNSTVGNFERGLL